MTALQPCGTYAAYRRHKRRGEPVDEACEAGRRRYATRWARQARAQYPMGTCAACERWRPIQRYGWCESCVTRWQSAGRPDSGPPPLDPEMVLQNRREGIKAAHAVNALDRAIRDGGWGWVFDSGRAKRMGATA